MTPEEIAAAAAAKAAADAQAAAEKIAADAKAAAEKAAADAEALKNKPTDKEAALLREVMEKKAKTKELEDKLKAFEGIDPEMFKTLKAAADKAEADRVAAEKTAAEKSGDFDRLKKMMADEHQKQLDKVTAENAATKSTLDGALKVINDLTVGSAFSNSSFITNELVLTSGIAKTVFSDHFDVEDGRVVAFDKPRGATNRTKMVDGSGNSIGFEDAMKKLVEANPDRDKMLRSKLKDGTGSKTDNTNGNNKTNTDGKLKGVDRIAAALAAGALKPKKT